MGKGGSFVKGAGKIVDPFQIYKAVGLGGNGGGGGGNGTPATPDYGQSMRDILRAQIDLAPDVYASEAIYQPKYADLESKIESQTTGNQLDLYKVLQPKYSDLENAYTKATQANQLQGLQERAPEYVQAFKEAQGTAGIDSSIKGYAETTLSDQMKQGFNLNPEEQRQLEQSTLSGYSSRGTALGNQAGLANVLNRYQYVQGRRQNALSQASGIGQYLSSQSAAPLNSFYQQPMYAGAFGGQAIGNAVGSQQQSGASLFNPESQTGMGSIYGAYNAQMGLSGAQMQADAAKSAGKSAMTGQIVGAAGMAAAAAFCWVARACFGTKTDRWKEFRNSMFRNASDKFISWYCRNGEQVAGLIKISSIAKFLGRIALCILQLKWILLLPNSSERLRSLFLS